MTAQTSERELLALAEALWLYEVADSPAALASRLNRSFQDQDQTSQQRWIGFASAALAHLAATRASAGDAPVAWQYRHQVDGIWSKGWVNITKEAFDNLHTIIADGEIFERRALYAAPLPRPDRLTEAG